MASLLIIKDETPIFYTISKRITTLGKDKKCDVSIPNLRDEIYHVLYDGKEYHLTSLSEKTAFLVNNKKIKKTKLANGDFLEIGGVKILFLAIDLFLPDKKDKDLGGYLQKIFEFNKLILEKDGIENILSALLDYIVELSKAEGAFLLLYEGEQLKIFLEKKMTYSASQEKSKISDSIIKRVLEKKEPVIIADAGKDDDFKNSKSIIDLNLHSVICLPLAVRGDMLGVLYLGSSSISSFFTQDLLEILKIFASEAALLIQNAILIDELKLANKNLTEELKDRKYGEIIGASKGMVEVYKRIEKLAGADISVLILGETGTGKELVAKTLHAKSGRAAKPFVAINCAAIPENLLESELFGHVKGAFTGASYDKVGKIEIASEGTLFLDEIGDMTMHLQGKLLRVLQDKEFTRVGAHKKIRSDFRLICATNRKLEEEIKKEKFRDDLYFRINEVSITLPPLRERLDDIELLCSFFLERFAKEYGKKNLTLSKDAKEKLRRYNWPGNVRELESALKKSSLLCEKNVIKDKDLGFNPEEFRTDIFPLNEAKNRFIKSYIRKVLEINNGNKAKTAKDLCVDVRSIFRYLEEV